LFNYKKEIYIWVAATTTTTTIIIIAAKWNQEAKPEVEVKPETHINLKVSDGSSEIFFRSRKPPRCVV
jgi:hypothetical protein